MRRDPPFRVAFFQTPAGNEPVREWLKDLSKEERTHIGEDIKTMQYRWPLGMPLVRSVGGGLFELRSNLPTRTARTLFFTCGTIIVLLHGFIKKTQQTPGEDLSLARKRKRNCHEILP